VAKNQTVSLTQWQNNERSRLRELRHRLDIAADTLQANGWPALAEQTRLRIKRIDKRLASLCESAA